jgi:hypothetical protein
MKKLLLLTNVVALFLATGAARANEFVVLLQKDNEKASVAFATMGMNCEEALASHERNRKAGTWLMYSPPGRWRALADRLDWLPQRRFKSSLPPEHGRETALP